MPRGAVRVLRRGVAASRFEEDAPTAARLLNRLGRLLVYHGEIDQARRVFEQSLRLADETGGGTALRHALANLSMLAGFYNECEPARAFAEAYYDCARREDDAELVAVALSHRGLCAYHRGDMLSAHDDLNESLALLTSAAPTFQFRRSAEAEIRVALARLDGAYSEAQQHLANAQQFAQDPYAAADLLFTQACLAYDQQATDDARALGRQAASKARTIDARLIHAESVKLLRALA